MFYDAEARTRFGRFMKPQQERILTINEVENQDSFWPLTAYISSKRNYLMINDGSFQLKTRREKWCDKKRYGDFRHLRWYGKKMVKRCWLEKSKEAKGNLVKNVLFRQYKKGHVTNDFLTTASSSRSTAASSRSAVIIRIKYYRRKVFQTIKANQPS